MVFFFLLTSQVERAKVGRDVITTRELLAKDTMKAAQANVSQNRQG